VGGHGKQNVMSAGIAQRMTPAVV